MKASAPIGFSQPWHIKQSSCHVEPPYSNSLDPVRGKRKGADEDLNWDVCEFYWYLPRHLQTQVSLAFLWSLLNFELEWNLIVIYTVKTKRDDSLWRLNLFLHSSPALYNYFSLSCIKTIWQAVTKQWSSWRLSIYFTVLTISYGLFVHSHKKHMLHCRCL